MTRMENESGEIGKKKVEKEGQKKKVEGSKK